MRKAGYVLILVSFFVLQMVFTATSFAFTCVGPAQEHCLQCHVQSDIHYFHWDRGIGNPDCVVCHCGDEQSSPCEPAYTGPVEAFCCTTCHDECFKVNEHTLNEWYDCTVCHQTSIGTDDDCDDVDNIVPDNCPRTPNGPRLGTCAKGSGMVIHGTGVVCTSDLQCESGETCQMAQEDVNSNGIGDVCECYADFDGDGSVYPSDLMVFLNEYGRTDCLINPPCQADFDGDGSVFPSDLMVFLGEYGNTGCGL